MERETAKTIVKVIAILGYIGGAFAILGGLFMIFLRGVMSSMMPRFWMMSGMMYGYNVTGIMITVFILAGLVMIAVGIFELFVAFGLWNFKKWSRIATIVLSVLNLLNFPIGTIISAAIIYFLGFNKDIIKLFRS